MPFKDPVKRRVYNTNLKRRQREAKRAAGVVLEAGPKVYSLSLPFVQAQVDKAVYWKWQQEEA